MAAPTNYIKIRNYNNFIKKNEVISIIIGDSFIYCNIEKLNSLDSYLFFRINYNKNQAIYTDDWEFLSKLRYE